MDVLNSEHEHLKQRYFHERRKNQRLKDQQASGRRFRRSSSKQEIIKLPDDVQPVANSTFNEEENDFRSGQC